MALLSYCGGSEDRANDGGIREIEDASSSAKTLASGGLSVEAGVDGPRVPSWMQPETTPPGVAKQNGSGYDNAAERPKQKSLLWQPHIRILLIINAIYPVCACCPLVYTIVGCA